jgi:hypothetical protein
VWCQQLPLTAWVRAGEHKASLVVATLLSLLQLLLPSRHWPTGHMPLLQQALLARPTMRSRVPQDA